MSESDLMPEGQEEEQMIDMICTRGCVLRAGETISPGDPFQAPLRNQAADGVFPVRWWMQTRKAAPADRPDLIAAYRMEKYDGREGGPATEVVPDVGAQDAKAKEK